MWYIHEYFKRVLFGSLFFRELKILLHLLNTERASNRCWSEPNTKCIAADSETSLIWPSSKVSQVQLNDGRGESKKPACWTYTCGWATWVRVTRSDCFSTFQIWSTVDWLADKRHEISTQIGSQACLCLLDQFCMLSQSQWHSSGWLTSFRGWFTSYRKRTVPVNSQIPFY